MNTRQVAEHVRKTASIRDPPVGTLGSSAVISEERRNSWARWMQYSTNMCPVLIANLAPTISIAEPSAPGDRPNDWFDSAGWQDGYATVLSESFPQTRHRASSASPPPRDLQTPQTISHLLLTRSSEPAQPMEHRIASYRDWKRTRRQTQDGAAARNLAEAASRHEWPLDGPTDRS